jgi:hypothetical protein
MGTKEVPDTKVKRPTDLGRKINLNLNVFKSKAGVEWQIQSFVRFLYIVNCCSCSINSIMANVPTPDYQNLWSNQIIFLRLEYGGTIQRPDANAFMERGHGVLIATARLAGCTPVSIDESPKWTSIVQNMANTMTNLQRVLRGKQLNSALHGVYVEVTRLLSPQREGHQRGKSQGHHY